MWRPGFSCLFRICRAAADFLKQRGAAGTAGVTQSDAGEGSVSSAPLLPTPGIRARRDGVFAKRVGDSAGSPAAGSGLFCVRIPAQRVPVLPRGAATAAAGGLRASRSRRLGCCGSTRRGERKKTALLHNYMLLAKCSRVIWAMRMNGLRQAERIMIIIIVQKY